MGALQRQGAGGGSRSRHRDGLQGRCCSFVRGSEVLHEGAYAFSCTRETLPPSVGRVLQGDGLPVLCGLGPCTYSWPGWMAVLSHRALA